MANIGCVCSIRCCLVFVFVDSLSVEVQTKIHGDNRLIRFKDWKDERGEFIQPAIIHMQKRELCDSLAIADEQN